MENPSLANLIRNSYPELARAIRSRATTILDRFRAIVKEVLPSADELTLTELIDHLPQAVEDLAATIGPDPGAVRPLVADSKQHGVCRYHQSFNLGELLVEYSVLRTIIVEEAAGALHRPLEINEILGLNAALDVASRRAVESFVAFQSAELQSASESHSKYLSFLSHDLRGSLNGILLMIEVLRRELTASGKFENSLEDLSVMRRSILETVSTMDRFLHAEKFRKGKVEVKISEVNLSTLVPEVMSQFAPQAREKGVEILVDTSACPHVRTDRELVSLILQNLVGNAVKYSSGGAVRLVTSITAEGTPRISVSDQGPGIAPEKLKDIFAPFTRGDTHGQHGVGLGLSIAQKAAELLCAKLWAESRPGRGSTFNLELANTAAVPK